MNNIYRHLKNVPRGVANRRAALNWIKSNNKSEGVLYFGDDDNTFHLKLFSEIRHTKVVSMFPVGLIGNYAVSSPVVRDVSILSTAYKQLMIYILGKSDWFLRFMDRWTRMGSGHGGLRC